MLEVKSVSGIKGKKRVSSWGMNLGVSEGFFCGFIEAVVGDVRANMALRSGKVGRCLKAAEIVDRQNCSVASMCAFPVFKFCEHCSQLLFCER